MSTTDSRPTGGHRGAAPRRADRSRRAGAARGPGAAGDRRAAAAALAVALGAARDGGRGAAGARRGLPGHGWQPEVRPDRSPARRPDARRCRPTWAATGTADDLSTPGPPRPGRRRRRRRRSSSSPSPRRTSTAGPGCRRRSAAPARRPTASPSSAPPSAPAHSTRSTRTATVTRSWCSTRAPWTVGRAGPSSRSSSTCATGCWCEAVARGPGAARAAATSPVPGSETEHYDLVHVHDVLVEDGTLVLEPIGRRVRPPAT